jgi:hypothetical protein
MHTFIFAYVMYSDIYIYIIYILCALVLIMVSRVAQSL